MTNEPSDIDIDQPGSQVQPSDEQLDAAAATDSNVIESLREQLAEAEKKALLHQADMENFRRRKSRETEDLVRYATMPLITSLLDVVDNLDRAIEAAGSNQGNSGLHEGVDLVATQLNTVLQNAGCKKIEALGQPFDPNLHEAIQMQPSDQPVNIVINEVQTGYQLHDRVVRPAKVIISTGPAG